MSISEKAVAAAARAIQANDHEYHNSLREYRKMARAALEAALSLHQCASSPHPRWKPGNKSDRHPQTIEEWDCHNDPVGEGLDQSRRRLNVAGDYDDPRAPDQMALVLRQDITRLMHDWIHKNAVFEIWCKERSDAQDAALAAAPPATVQEDRWQPIETADRFTAAWLFTPGSRLGSDCADDVRLDSPCNWGWATMWMPAQIPAPPVLIAEKDRADG